MQCLVLGLAVVLWAVRLYYLLLTLWSMKRDELGCFISEKRSLSVLKVEGCTNLGFLNISSLSRSMLWLSDLYCISKTVINCPNLKEVSLDFARQESDSTDLIALIDCLGCTCSRLRNIHIASIRLCHEAVLALAGANLRYIEFYDAMTVPMVIALSGQPLLGQPVMVKPSEAEKNVVQSTATGSSLAGAAVARKIYVGNLHFNIIEDQLRQVLGSCEVFEERQVGNERFNIFSGCPLGQTATIVLRGGADQFIKEAERSLHDVIMIVRRAMKNSTVVASGGAIDLVADGDKSIFETPCSHYSWEGTTVYKFICQGLGGYSSTTL